MVHAEAFFINRDYFSISDCMVNPANILEHVTTLEEYNRLIAKYRVHYGEVYYRGQSGEYSDITPSIARDDGYLENEGIIFNEVTMRPEFKNSDSSFKKLSIMQHNHIPTRLIDLSSDPLVALFFAVDDTEKKHPGRVYVYTEKGCDIDNKRVRALSFLATVQDYSLEDICVEFACELGITIAPDEFLSLIGEPVLIKHSHELEGSNIRLGNQKGTFIICNNVIKDGKILRKLDSIKSIKPAVVINIPFAYKKQIKEQLETLHNVNELRMFPELPTVGHYIKEKYKRNNFFPDSKYGIIERKNVSIAGAKRISFVISLVPPLTINQIQEVAKDLIGKHSREYDVIWVYVAENSDDYIMRNWIFSAQWINPKLDDKFKPMPFKIDHGKGYYFGEHTHWSSLKEYSKNIFDCDKTLFICHQWVYNEILPIYQELETADKNYDRDILISLIEKHHKALQRAKKRIGAFGKSHNKEFVKFLEYYYLAIVQLNNLITIVENKNYNEDHLRANIKISLKVAKEKIKLIEKENKKWREELHLTDFE